METHASEGSASSAQAVPRFFPTCKPESGLVGRQCLEFEE